MASNEKHIRADAMQKETYNNYYMRISGFYRIGKWILLLLFTAYLTIMLLLYRDSMTYDNFLYLMRHFNISAGTDGAFSSLIYNEQQNMTFDLYKGDVVVAGSSEILFINGNGAVSLRDETGCETPVLKDSDKYLLLYDEGGTSYSLYTPLSCVAKKSTNDTIQCAAIADSGAYAIATRSGEAKYLITLYSAAFRETAYYYRDSYVTALSLSPSGKSLAIVGVAADTSSVSGILTLCDVGSKQTTDISLGEKMPLSVSHFEDGMLLVVCDSAALFYKADGTPVQTVSFHETTLASFDISEKRAAFLCSEDILGTSQRILVLDSGGNTVADTSTATKALSLIASDGASAAYIRGRDSVMTLSTTSLISPLASYSGNLLAILEAGGRPIFCFSTNAHTAAAES